MLGGRLKHPISIYTRSRASDGAGGASTADVLVVSTKADVHPVSGSEQWRAGQLEPRPTLKVIMRYHASVQTGQYLEWRDEEYRITSAIDVKAKQQALELRCEGTLL